MAASKERRVLVLGSKKSVARIFPRQDSRRYSGLSSIFSAREKSSSSSLALKSPGSTKDRPLSIGKPTTARRKLQGKSLPCDGNQFSTTCLRRQVVFLPFVRVHDKNNGLKPSKCPLLTPANIPALLKGSGLLPQKMPALKRKNTRITPKLRPFTHSQ
jgi:hypothetical protein